MRIRQNTVNFAGIECFISLCSKNVLAWNSINVRLEKAQWSEQASSQEQYVFGLVSAYSVLLQILVLIYILHVFVCLLR